MQLQLHWRTLLLLIALFFAVGFSATAQDVPVLLVTPSKVNMVVGDAHAFRPVDTAGRLQPGVQWFVSPWAAAEVQQGDELVLIAKQPGKITVTASIDGHEANAEVTVIEGARLAQGSTKWELTELPGKETTRSLRPSRAPMAAPTSSWKRTARAAE